MGKSLEDFTITSKACMRPWIKTTSNTIKELKTEKEWEKELDCSLDFAVAENFDALIAQGWILKSKIPMVFSLYSVKKAAEQLTWTVNSAKWKTDQKVGPYIEGVF